MLNAQLDFFVSKPGLNDVVHCRVCGQPCDVSRNVIGPTSWATAIARKHTRHDSFACPHADIEWHQQAKALVIERDQTASPRLRQLIQLDIDELLTAHVAQ